MFCPCFPFDNEHHIVYTSYMKNLTVTVTVFNPLGKQARPSWRTSSADAAKVKAGCDANGVKCVVSAS